MREFTILCMRIDRDFGLRGKVCAILYDVVLFIVGWDLNVCSVDNIIKKVVANLENDIVCVCG